MLRLHNDGMRKVASQFSDYYRRSDAIHEAIASASRNRPGNTPLDMIEITQLIRERHPDIGLAPTELSKAIIRAAQAAGVQLRGQVRIDDCGCGIST